MKSRSEVRPRDFIDAPPNNGMHPTADTTAFIFGNLSGRRVMPGVRLLQGREE